MGRPTNLTNRIAELRAAHGAMTQAALAEAVGVSRHTIMAIEADRYAPSLESAFRIARVFGLTVDEVFRWRE